MSNERKLTDLEDRVKALETKQANDRISGNLAIKNLWSAINELRRQMGLPEVEPEKK